MNLAQLQLRIKQRVHVKLPALVFISIKHVSVMTFFLRDRLIYGHPDNKDTTACLLVVRINLVLLIKCYYSYRRASAGSFKNLNTRDVNRLKSSHILRSLGSCVEFILSFVARQTVMIMPR